MRKTVLGFNAYHLRYRQQQRGGLARDVVTEKYILGMRILMLGYEHALRMRDGGLTYDPLHNVAYLCLLEKTGEVETIRVSDELNVDIAPDGSVYGIELLNANEQLRRGDHGLLVVVNEAIGEERRIPLATKP